MRLQVLRLEQSVCRTIGDTGRKVEALTLLMGRLQPDQNL